MRKTFTTTLMVSAFVLAFSSLAMARSEGRGGHGGHGGHGGSTPGTHGSIGGSTPSAPANPGTPSASPGNSGTEADTAWFDFGNRKAMNPGFCQRNPTDYYVRAALTDCN